MILTNDMYSQEEFNLYNPAYAGVVLYQAIREYQTKSSKPFHCTLKYLVAPLSLSPKYLRLLPSKTVTSVIGWVAENQGELINFSKTASAYIGIVNSAAIFLLKYKLLLLDQKGYYSLTDISLPKKPKYVKCNPDFNQCYLAAGFLGRWFSEITVEAVYIHLGVRP
ncbi:three component ABC system middle component [Zooshikella sp. RANM57]|uniref:three component ABC system middle component n=1 Tax=Zooshikella sp. RANM57 TaxID=3425863 RepID=UPI003D6FC4C0